MTDLTRTTLADLYEFDRREELDRVVRAVGLDLDLDYLDGLRSLEAWAEMAAGEFAGKREQVEPTSISLAAIIGRSPIRMTRFKADLGAIETGHEKTERAFTLAREQAEPEGQEVDATSRCRRRSCSSCAVSASGRSGQGMTTSCSPTRSASRSSIRT
jgi:hypothetical protein